MSKSNTAIRELLMGHGESDERFAFVERRLVQDSVDRMNRGSLPILLPLYDDEKIPTNQRNLTDVRTRMGNLLEYELAKSMNGLLDSLELTGIRVMYVVAHKFPDLAVRNLTTGELGIRIEVKAIEAVAEEKAANFDTLLKDIRKGTDYVTVMVWEWSRPSGERRRVPQVHKAYVFDAYELAKLRDIHWLCSPPSDLGDGRQGYDLCYGVNCRQGAYNKEEGNYGKLMRIFRESDKKWLPADMEASATLARYFSFRQEVVRLGLLEVARMLAASAGCTTIPLDATPCSVASMFTLGDKRILLLGAETIPVKSVALLFLKTVECDMVMLLNEKFNWRVRNAKWEELGQGRKPSEAAAWLQRVK